ncbi:hypothetical protein LZ554_004423 [Drepanopeziza brunnea f. sp. 'monogermtubi']|nr:hypothetical protein LZ554_004423 [Drepanopeziza brunnea f. sp. 'monogermtubi']
MSSYLPSRLYLFLSCKNIIPVCSTIPSGPKASSRKMQDCCNHSVFRPSSADVLRIATAFPLHLPRFPAAHPECLWTDRPTRVTEEKKRHAEIYRSERHAVRDL